MRSHSTFRVSRLAVSYDDLEQLRRRQVVDWPDHVLKFSCNYRGEVWPTTGWGRSAPETRKLIKGVPLLDTIVGRVLGLRPDGGRIFVSERGVWVSDMRGAGRAQVMEFLLREGRSRPLHAAFPNKLPKSSRSLAWRTSRTESVQQGS